MSYYHTHPGGLPPGASDKPGLYTPGGFTAAGAGYPPTQPGLPPGQSARYPQSVTQAYAMNTSPAFYTPPGSYPALSAAAAAYPPATQGFHTVGGYPPSLQSLPSTTMAAFQPQYGMPTYIGPSQLGPSTQGYAASGLPVTSAIYPNSAYSSTPIAASQLQQGRGYMAYPPSQLGTYPGASYQPQPPF